VERGRRLAGTLALPLLPLSLLATARFWERGPGGEGAALSREAERLRNVIKE